MAYDTHKDLAYSTIPSAGGPSPALSGNSLKVQPGDGALFASQSQITVWPAGTLPTHANAEIMQLNNVIGDELIVARAQEGTTPLSVVSGYQVAATISTKPLTDLETAVTNTVPTFNVFNYGAVGNGSTDDGPAFNLAITAAFNAGGGIVFAKGTFKIATRLIPLNNVTVQGAGKTVTTLTHGVASDWMFLNPIDGAYRTLTNFWIKDLTIDLQNTSAASGVQYNAATSCGMERVALKNGANSGWLAYLGTIQSATADIVNFDNRYIDCDFDTHTGGLEMFLIFNAKYTKIIRPTFTNNTNGPILGLWQKCYGTFIDRPKFLNNTGSCLYYSVTVEDTTIVNPYFENCAGGITGSNVSDNGQFGLTQAQGLQIINPVFIGGTNSTGSNAIQLGAVNDALIVSPIISGYQIGIRINNGNSPANAAATNWSIINPEIKNCNPTNNVHVLHPGIFFSGVGGSLYGKISFGSLYDDQSIHTQRYPISFDGAFIWDNIDIVNNRLSADAVNGGTSVNLSDGASLGSNVNIAANKDYSGTNPAQNDLSSVVHLSGTEVISGTKTFSAATTFIGNTPGDSRSALEIGGQMVFGPNSGDPTVRSLFSGKRFVWSSNGGSNTASVLLDTGDATFNSATLVNPLAIGQGGTGSSTQNFVDLTSVQTAAGAKTFTNQVNFTADPTVTRGARAIYSNGLYFDSNVSSSTDGIHFRPSNSVTPNETLLLDATQWSYFDGNANGVGPTSHQGLGIAWNRTAGNGDTVLMYNTAAGSAPRLALSSYTGSSYKEEASLRGGLFGVGITNPTAYLHPNASTKANASLRIPSGVAPTSANDGDIWQDGVHLYAKIAGQIFQLDSTTVTTTSTSSSTTSSSTSSTSSSISTSSTSSSTSISTSSTSSSTSTSISSTSSSTSISSTSSSTSLSSTSSSISSTSSSTSISSTSSSISTSSTSNSTSSTSVSTSSTSQSTSTTVIAFQ